MGRQHIALLTPLPPARSGTADYAAALIEELDKISQLDVFETPPVGFSTARYDHTIYQIANNIYHADIYKTALEQPGAIVLHESSVHYLVQAITLSRGRESAYAREVLYELRGREFEGGDDADIPIDVPQPHSFMMLRRLLERSRACIVHSSEARGHVRLKGFTGPLEVIPHGATLHEPDRERYRKQLGLQDDVPLIGVFGYQRPDKRIWDSLIALKMLQKRCPEAVLLVLGQPHPQVPVEESVKQLGLDDRVLIRGRQSLTDFDGYLGACDIVLNPRRTSFGEASGTSMRAFGMGRPTVVSDIGWSHELPDDVCLKVPQDRYELDVTVEALAHLIENPADAREIGVNAQAWVAKECTWERVAQRYVDFLDRSADSKSTRATSNRPRGPLSKQVVMTYLERWIEGDSPAGGYFRTHDYRLARTLQLTPPGRSGSRILELGCYMQITPALRGLLGYGDVRGGYMGKAGGSQRSTATAHDGEVFSCNIDQYDAERDRFPYSSNYFDTVLCCELLEHLERDPMHMMSEIHRVLKPDGVLVLSTPNAASLRSVSAAALGYHPNLFSKYVIPTLTAETRHAREYTARELLWLFRDSGLTVRSVETGPYGTRTGWKKWLHQGLQVGGRRTALREDCVYLTGRKTGELVNRYPDWLYERH